MESQSLKASIPDEHSIYSALIWAQKQPKHSYISVNFKIFIITDVNVIRPLVRPLARSFACFCPFLARSLARYLTIFLFVGSLQIPGYTLISQGAICSSHAGLAIYVQEHYKYKLLSCYQHTKIWEGLFIEIESKEF